MAESAARFRDVVAVREFRFLWAAQAQSRVGDQIARVAVALLVLDRTGSAGLTALTYALTYLPPLLTAPLLAGLADRYSRRAVMVAVDLLRAALIGAMAIPGTPLAVVAVLLVAATCPEPLFSAARVATVPRTLPGPLFPVGMGVITSTDQIAQIAGFALGGVLVGAYGPHVALAVNAGTFLVSAALLHWGVGPHLPERDGAGPARGSGFALAGIRLVVGDRRLLAVAGLVWLVGCYVVAEALAAPYAAQIGAGGEAAGVLMASVVVGTAIGSLLVAKLDGAWRRRLVVPLAVAAGVPLAATAAAPPLWATIALWTLAGVFHAYIVLAQIRFTQFIPDGMRSRAIGFAAAGLQTAQGLGIAAGGALAEWTSPSTAIGVCAAVGACLAALIGLVSRVHRADPPAPQSQSGQPVEPSEAR
ncbi:MFS transporter [Glycomyces terrestris]|uniref:MFS transporter n=1 Tax=Glycomyces terrestris TaxID=2493553 RepID=A0A426V344_9ACTN|nr:MFS transporter [Glycomyces terrestris]RRS01277.1 MFS transporter [Glycomyces terrestris]